MTGLDAPTAPLPRHTLAGTVAMALPPRPAEATTHRVEYGPGCGALDRASGLICTENVGHEPADHVARGERLQVLARWSSTGGP